MHFAIKFYDFFRGPNVQGKANDYIEKSYTNPKMSQNCLIFCTRGFLAMGKIACQGFPKVKISQL
jgi:hypothetical protein